MNKAFNRKGKLSFGTAYLGRLTKLKVGGFVTIGRVMTCRKPDHYSTTKPFENIKII